MANTQTATSFPKENVSPKEKSKNEWGLQAAKAMFFHSDSYGANMFYNNRDLYDEFIRFAMGKQSEDLVKPAVGINTQNQEKSYIGGIDWSPKTYAVKRVDSTVSKIYSRQYDPVATAIDPLSSDKRESFKSQVKAWMDNLSWLQERQTNFGLDMMPQGMDMDTLPLNDEALNIYMHEDFKLIEEINLELGIKYQLNRNNFDIIKEQADFFIAALPVAGIWVGLDSENMPVIKLLSPDQIIAPTSQFNDFKRIAYCGYVDNYTVSEFRKMVGGEIPKSELDALIESHSKKGNYSAHDYSERYQHNDKDVDKIQVMHFEVAQTDEYTKVEYTDSFGNRRLGDKPYDYYRGNEDNFKTSTKDKTDRVLYRIPKRTTYGGYWVVGSDTVFGWGEKNHCKGELGYKLRASRMVNGISTCLVEQMIPCIKAIERYDKKIQMCVAGALPGIIIGIDHAALKKLDLKAAGIQGPEQHMDLLFQKGIINYDSSDWGSGDTRKPFTVERGGMSEDIVNYITLLKMELENLDEIIGYNRVTSASTLSPETGARVAQQMEAQTDTALDHLYRADRGLCLEVYKSMGHLHKISVQRNPEKYIPVLGEEAVMRLIMSAPYDEYGIDVEARPSQAEWRLFYERIDSDQRISPEDKAAVERCQSIKQAYAYLRAIGRRKTKEEQAFELNKIKVTTDQAQQSAQITIQGDMAKLQFERETDLIIKNKEMEQDYAKHKYKMEEISALVSGQNQGKIAEAVIEAETAKEVASKKSLSKK